MKPMKRDFVSTVYIIHDDKVLLAKCIDDLITASPLAAVAATRFKKIMRKAGPDTELLFQELLTDLTPEPLRVTLWP